MNKAELVEKLAKETGLTKKDARAALDGVVKVITKALSKNEPVIITGFGKFETRKRKATTRMNPQTGKRIKTPAKVIEQQILNAPGGHLISQPARAAMKAGGREAAELIGRQALGAAALGTLAYWAGSGNVTGNGPSNPAERAQWLLLQ